MTDNHTCEQLLCAQQPVLFLWMLLHKSPRPVALSRTRKTNHQQHLERKIQMYVLYTAWKSPKVILFSHASLMAPGRQCWSTTSVQTEISQKLFDGLPLKFVQTFVVLRRRIIQTFISLSIIHIQILWIETQLLSLTSHSALEVGANVARTLCPAERAASDANPGGPGYQGGAVGSRWNLNEQLLQRT